MYRTLLGEAGFKKGMKLYFERHDGGAVTCDDFRAAMAGKGIRESALLSGRSILSKIQINRDIFFPCSRMTALKTTLSTLYSSNVLSENLQNCCNVPNSTTWFDGRCKRCNLSPYDVMGCGMLWIARSLRSVVMGVHH